MFSAAGPKDDCPVDDDPFVNRIVDEVAVDGVGAAGPVVVMDELAFVRVLLVVGLFPSLKDAGGTEDP